MTNTRGQVPRAMIRYGLWNAPFAFALFAVDLTPGVVRTAFVAWILFVAPGLAYTDRRSRPAFDVAASVVIRSTICVIGCWIALALLPGSVNRLVFLAVLALVVNVGLLQGSRAGWFTPVPWDEPYAKALVVVAVLFFGQSYTGAAYRIPALEDQDMEIQGTAYGLVHGLTPDMVTNRGTTHFFAHPPLLHAWAGLSMLVTDELESLRFYHEQASAARGDARAELDARFRQTFTRFEQSPHLLGTRTPSIVLGVVAVVLLSLLIRELTGSNVAAIGGAIVYATLPEVYVRSAYGGYMAITNAWALIAIRAYLAASGMLTGPPPCRALWGAFGTTFAGAWANQKSVVIALAAGLHGGITSLTDALRIGKVQFWRHRRLTSGLVAVAGFTIGWALFAAWGLGISRAEFVADHLRTHLVDRFQFNTIWLIEPAGSVDKYPSIGALWTQYASHIGWPIALVGLVALTSAIRRFRQSHGVLLMWFLVGGVLFSLADWRQTKHLALLLPPLVTLMALQWSQMPDRTRSVLTTVIGIGVLWNVWRVAQLMIDFTYLTPYRMW